MAATRTRGYLTVEQCERLDQVIEREHRSLAAVIRTPTRIAWRGVAA